MKRGCMNREREEREIGGFGGLQQTKVIFKGNN
jgi:hypothetical protein